jgi:hypothetical protein
MPSRIEATATRRANIPGSVVMLAKDSAWARPRRLPRRSRNSFMERPTSTGFRSMPNRDRFTR